MNTLEYPFKEILNCIDNTHVPIKFRWAKRGDNFIVFDLPNEMGSVQMNKNRTDVFKRQPYCLCCLSPVVCAKIKGIAIFFYVKNPHGDLTQVTIDHIVSKSNGGSNTIDNMQTLCKNCNQLKADKNISVRVLRRILISKGGRVIKNEQNN